MYQGFPAAVTWTKIGRASLSAAASWTSPTWSPGAFQALALKLRITAGTLTSCDLALVGSTGTARSVHIYGTAAAGTVQNAAVCRIAYNGIATANVVIGIETGGVRDISGSLISPDTTVLGQPLLATLVGMDPDTTHDITGVTLTMNGGTATGTVSLLGGQGA